MAFDTKQLKTIVSITNWTAGSSFTFEIARKVGLPDYIIKNANNKISDNKKPEGCINRYTNRKTFY